MWKIVIIDDDRNVLEGLKSVIPWAELDAEWVGEAMDGEEGLRVVQECQPDIVITDIYMPVLNGLDMVEQLNKVSFHGKIIVLSGYADFEYARQALRLGIADYLNKPISVQTIRDVLGRTIEELEEELEQKHRNEELEEKLKLYEPFVEKEWIKSVCTGPEHTKLPDTRMIPEAYRYWNGCRHAVIGIEIIRTDRVTRASTKDLSLFRFAIANIIQELSREEWPDSHYVELFSSHAAIILHAPNEEWSEFTMKQAYRFGERVIQSVRSFLDITLHAGIGTFKPNWMEIADSTEEAFQALYFKNTAPIEGIHLYEYVHGGKIEQQAYPISLRPVKFYQQMAESMKLFQEDKAKEIVDDYFDQWRKGGAVSARNLEMLGSELWTIFAYTLFEVGVQLEDIAKVNEVTRELRFITTLEQLREWLYGKIDLICGSRSSNENIKHRQAVDFIVQFIHEHYAEPITITDLADRIHISRNYLSLLFKKAMGESFNSYLTRIRMEKAKEMILEGKYLIYEVADRVGYKYVPYFSTLFKKYTGCNPTDLYKNKS